MKTMIYVADDEKNIRDLISESEVLSDFEIKILLDDQKKINAWMKQIDDKYDIFDEKVAPLERQLQSLYQKIDEIDDENEDIWEKILQNYFPEGNPENGFILRKALRYCSKNMIDKVGRSVNLIFLGVYIALYALIFYKENTT